MGDGCEASTAGKTEVGAVRAPGNPDDPSTAAWSEPTTPTSATARGLDNEELATATTDYLGRPVRPSLLRSVGNRRMRRRVLFGGLHSPEDGRRTRSSVGVEKRRRERFLAALGEAGVTPGRPGGGWPRRGHVAVVPLGQSARVPRRLVAMIDDGFEGEALVQMRALVELGLAARVDGSARPRVEADGAGTRLTTRGVVHLRVAVAGRSTASGTASTVIVPLRAVVVDERFASADVVLGVRWLQKREAVANHVRQHQEHGLTVASALRVPWLTLDELVCASEADGRDEQGAAVAVAAKLTVDDDGTDGADEADGGTWDDVPFTKFTARTAAAAEAMARFPSPTRKAALMVSADDDRRGDDSVQLRATAVRRLDKLREAQKEHVRRYAEQLAAEEAARIDAVAAEFERTLRSLTTVGEEGASEARDGAVLGAAVHELDERQKARLLQALRMLAIQLADPRKVPRRADARAIPARFELRLKADDDGRPERAGVTRAYAEEKRAELVRQADLLAQLGLIHETGPDAWSSAVVLARKANGTWRFCVDYSGVNRRTADAVYAMPDAGEMLREVAGHRYYSVYDLTDAFFQIPVEESSQRLLGFEVPGRGRFTWTVMPMGVRDAPGVFQRAVERMFAPLIHRGVRVFVDDLVVYANTVDELLRLTEKVHAVFAAYDLRVNSKKAQLFQTEARVLGRVVSQNRIRVAPESVRALREYERPRTVHDMQRFLGLAQYHGSFIRGLGDYVAALTEIEVAARASGAAQRPKAGDSGAVVVRSKKQAKDRTPLDWTPAAEKAFEALRAALSDDASLVIPPSDKLDGRLRVEADAATASASSGGGVGGCVTWLDDEGRWRLVTSYSRVLSKQERRFTATEVEMLGLVEVVRAAAWILRKARRVRVLTDHQALSFIATLAASDHGRLSRWAVRLMEHDLAVEYRPGAENVVADALSRAPPPEGTPIRDLLISAAYGVPEPRAAQSRLADGVDVAEQMSALGDGDVDLAVVDWPWRYADASTRWFRRMPTEHMQQMQLGRIMASDSVLVLCVPPVLVQEAVFAVREHVGEEWKLWQTWTWSKECPAPSRRGARCDFELFLLFARGDLGRVLRPRDERAELRTTLTGRQREPARKPDSLYRALERLVREGATKLDVFARETRPGWLGVGDERTKFDGDGLARVAAGLEGGVAASDLADEAPVLAHFDGEVGRHALFYILDDRWAELVDADDEQWQRRLAKWREHRAEDGERARRTVRRARLAIEWVAMPARAVLRCWQRNEETRLAPIFRIDDRARLPRAEEERAVLNAAAANDDEVQVPMLVTGETAVALPPRANSAGRLDRRPLAAVWLPQSTEGLELARAVMGQLHVQLGHAGTGRVWPEWRRTGWDIADAERLLTTVVQTCTVCAARKGHPRKWKPTGGGRPTDGTAAPGLWSSVHLDHVEIKDVPSSEGHTAVLSITDAFSRKRVLAPVRTMDASETAAVVLRQWVRFFGWPDRLVTDRGAAFASELMRELEQLVGVGRAMTTAYHPEANGVEERGHATMADITAALLHDLGTAGVHWHRVLPAVELAMNTTVNKTTGLSPDHLVFCQRPRLAANLVTPLCRQMMDDGRVDALGPTRQGAVARVPERRRVELEDLGLVSAEVWDVALRRAERVTARQRLDAEEVRRPVVDAFQPGDYVMVYDEPTLARDLPCPRKFVARRWSGPYRVVRTHRGVVLSLVLASDPLQRRTVTAQRAKTVRLAPDVRAKYEEWYEETLRDDDGDIEQDRRRQASAEERVWELKPGEDAERFGFEIINITGKGKHRVVRVRWDDDGSEGDVPYKQLREDAPDQLAEWEVEHPDVVAPRKKKEKKAEAMARREVVRDTVVRRSSRAPKPKKG